MIASLLLLGIFIFVPIKLPNYEEKINLIF